MKNNKSLLPYSDYYKEKRLVPYFYIARNNNQLLYYYGVSHFNNPKDRQVKVIKSLWRQFLGKTRKQNCIAIIELIRPDSETEPEAILSGGESGLVTHLAKKGGVEIFCPEPDIKNQIEGLALLFPREEIVYFFCVRTLGLFDRSPIKIKAGAYLKKILAALRQELGWENFDFSLGNMQEIHKRLFNNDFNPYDSALFRRLINPSSEETMINSIAQESYIIRDTHVVNEIKKLWDHQKNLFVVYGAMHAHVQEPALKSSLQHTYFEHING